MIESREANDFSRQVIIDVLPNEQMDDESDRALKEFKATHAERRSMGEKRQDKLTAEVAGRNAALSEYLCEQLDKIGHRSKQERDNVKFHERMELAEARSKARWELKFETGSTDVARQATENRRLGLTLGLIMSAIDTAAPVLSEYLLDTGERPVEPFAKGQNDENKEKELILKLWLDGQHREADYREHVQAWVYDACRFPIGVLRQRWHEEVSMSTDPDTKQQVETISRRGLRLDTWSPTDVYFSDLDTPRVEDQTSVIWYSVRTIAQIEAEEAIRTVDEFAVPGGDGQPDTESFIESGRFHNLEALRLKADNVDASTEGDGMDHQTHFEWATERLEADANVRKGVTVFGLLEFEGYMNMTRPVNEDIITPELLEFWGIPIGERQELENMSKRELGRKLSRICWNISMTHDGTLIEFRPSPYRTPRNTAVVARYLPGEGLYGRSIVDVSYDIEDAIDRILNDNLWISIRRANPSYLAQLGVGLNSHGEQLSPKQIETMLSGLNKVVFTKNQYDIRQVLQALLPETNAAWMDEVEKLTVQLEERTMITDAVKGEASLSSSTATERRQNLNQGVKKLIMRGAEIGKALERIDEQLLEDISWFYKVEEFERATIQMAGIAGLGTFYIYPTLEGLVDEIKLVHTGAPAGNKEIRLQQFSQWVELNTASGILDPELTAVEHGRMLGVDFPERFIAGGSKTTKPEDEIKAIAQGHYIAPHPDEDVMEHYMKHLLQVASVAPDAMQQFDMELVELAFEGREPQLSVDPPGLENMFFDPDQVVAPLIFHTLETEDNFRALSKQAEQAAMQQQQGLPGGAPGGALPPPQGAPGEAATTLPPSAAPSETSMQNGLEQQARLGVPANAESTAAPTP